MHSGFAYRIGVDRYHCIFAVRFFSGPLKTDTIKYMSALSFCSNVSFLGCKRTKIITTKMKKVLLTFCAVLMTVMSFAQATLITRVNFYKAYLDVPIVKKASLANGKMTEEMMDYIMKKSNPADVKYAIVNALGYDGKAANNGETNEKFCSDYLKANYENGYWANVIAISGISASMSMQLYLIYCDPLNKQALTFAEVANNQNVANMNTTGLSKATDIIYNMIAIESTMEDVGDVTPMGTQEGFIEPVKDILSICYSDADLHLNDMRKSALDIIYNFFKEYDREVATIKIVNKSSNPYQISINGDVIGNLGGGRTYEKEVDPGYYHIKAVQVSGYMFSPTVNNRDVNVENGDSKTVYVGFED